ncbi:MAG: hypothetical protein D3903_10495 [Candidatus Electrothrix sp. GM3_4]|nr:hypothetical protein [Candidatus Electrothrix sp. GM3_4]
MQKTEGLVRARMLMAFCPPLRMVGNVFAWLSPVDQLAALDVVLVFPCPPLHAFARLQSIFHEIFPLSSSRKTLEPALLFAIILFQWFLKFFLKSTRNHDRAICTEQTFTVNDVYNRTERKI